MAMELKKIGIQDVEEMMGLGQALAQFRMHTPEKIIELLSQMAFPEDGGIGRHEGSSILLPQDMDLEKAIVLLQRKQEDLKEPTRGNHFFECALDDMLVALEWAIRQVFGFSTQQSIMTFFGKIAPQTKPVTVGLDEDGKEIIVQVPNGRISLPGLYDEGEKVGYIDTGISDAPYISAYVRKRDQPLIGKLIELVKSRLETHSIYRGKIIKADYTFINLNHFNADDLILNQIAQDALDSYVLLPLREPDMAQKVGVEPGRSVLLYGGFGTGKTMTMMYIAQEASACGNTVIIGGPDDDVIDLVTFARQYQPSVILMEDIDAQTDGERDSDLNAILNTVSGILGRNDRVLTVMTTNHPDRIYEGMWRPGRISVAVELDGLDATGMCRMGERTGLKFEGVDWDVLAEEYGSLSPAYDKEAFNRAALKATAENTEVVGHDDLQLAFASMKMHYDMQTAGSNGACADTIEDIISDVVSDIVDERVRSLLNQAGFGLARTTK